MNVSGVGGVDDLRDGTVDVCEAGVLVVIDIADREKGERDEK
jgi:hypothetical protein